MTMYTLMYILKSKIFINTYLHMNADSVGKEQDFEKALVPSR